MHYCPVCHAENAEGASACASCGTPLALTAAPTLTRGAIIGSRYEILALLGKGGMGMVFKAHDRVLDETVALKILRPDVAGSGEMLRRFRSEIKLARKVRHKNICGIHEYGEDGNLQYIAMEFIQGIDLKRLLKEKGPPAAEDAFSIAIQLARGLQGIHEVGIIHRDLKTANAMIDDLGTVHLMDFGIAKKFDAESSLGATAVGHIVGTPEYMSPEQARDEKIDFRSDIYALGVMIFEIFTGRVPFQAETPIATIFKHLQAPPPLDDALKHGMPAALAPVLTKMLAKNASERYQNARAVVEALRQARIATFPDIGMTPPPGETLKAQDKGSDALPEAHPPSDAAAQPTVRTLRMPAATLLKSPLLEMPTTVKAAQPQARSVLLWLLLPVFALSGLAVVAVAVWQLKGPQPPDNGGLLPTTTTTTLLPLPQTPWPATPEPTLEPMRTPIPVTPPAPVFTPGRINRPTPTATLRLGPTAAPSRTPLPIEKGTLVIVVRPWAEVTLDGDRVGTTPMRPLKLAVGRYSIVLDHPNYKPVRRKAVIEAGQETRIEVDLSWEAVPR